MICRRCGADVAPTKFCARCGALLNGKRCNTCGAIMGINEEFCAECGTPVPGQAPPQSNYGGQPNNYGGYAPQPYPAQQPTALKKRPKHQTVLTGNKHVRLRGLIGSLGTLAALAVMVYFYVFGDLLTLDFGMGAEAYSPILFSTGTFSFDPMVGSWSLIANFQSLIEYFTNFANIGGSWLLLLENIPVILFQLAYFISAVLLVLAVLIAVIKFISGMLSNKEFDLMMPLQLGLIAFLSMFASLVMLSNFELLFTADLIPMDFSISYTSGLMIGIYASVGALVLQIALNVALAGKRFAKGGAIAKWVSNIGFLAGAVLMFLFIPFNISMGGEEVSLMSLLILGIFGFIGGGEVGITIFVYIAILATSVISFIWMLSSAAAKAGKRAARTFKFDGYADKGCFRKGLAALITVVTFTVVTVLLKADITTNLILFIAGGAIMFVFSIFNRFVLNKDQLV